MDSSELLQQLDKEHGKKPNYEITVKIENIDEITAERITKNLLNKDSGLSNAMTMQDKESISPKETSEKNTRNLKPTLEVVDIITEEPNKDKTEKDTDAR